MHLLPISIWIIDGLLVLTLILLVRRERRFDPNNCCRCGSRLTAEERMFYESACEVCAADPYRDLWSCD